MAFQRCVETAVESWRECAEERDEGHSACSRWDDRCCDWWPCSWGCQIFTWLCVAWVWISNVVCVAWKTVTAVVCVAWEVVSIVAAPLAILVDLILAIPFVGRVIAELLNVITEIVWRIVNLVLDAFLGVFGLDLVKYLRIGIVILRDDKNAPVALEAGVQAAFDAAKVIHQRAANVRLVLEGVRTVGGPSPAGALDVACDLSSWAADLGAAGSYFERQAVRFWDSRLSRAVGLSSPITVFAIRRVDPGLTQGCSLGPLTDYVLIEGPRPVCLAHELGHACGLIVPMHHPEPGNLNHATCGGTALTAVQRAIVRSSRHVTYF